MKNKQIFLILISISFTGMLLLAKNSTDILLEQVKNNASFKEISSETASLNSPASLIPTMYMCPSTRPGGDIKIKREDDLILFIYKKGDYIQRFSLIPSKGLPSLICDVGDMKVQYFTGKGVALANAPKKATVWHLKQIKRIKNGFQLDYGISVKSGQIQAPLVITMTLCGKTLRADISSNSSLFSKFDSGIPIIMGEAKTKEIFIPFYNYTNDMKVQVFIANTGTLFALTTYDFTKSNASWLQKGQIAEYHPLTNGKRLPFNESIYFSASREIGEVFPNNPWEQSPYIKELSRLMVLDLWSGSFKASEKLIRKYKTYGIDDLFIVHHTWQWGENGRRNFPKHFPAGFEGDDALKKYSLAAKELKYRFALHENYTQSNIISPLYDENNIALDSAGLHKTPFNAAPHEVQNRLNKLDKQIDFLSWSAPEIHRRYNTTGSMHDVASAVPPWRHVDMSNTSPWGGSIKGVTWFYAELHRKLRDIHDGPAVGEGAVSWFWAGAVDAVDAERGTKAARGLLVPDFNLTKVKPKAINHGMSYNLRWLGLPGYNNWFKKSDAYFYRRFTPAFCDEYRMENLLFGHAAYVDTRQVYWMRQVFKEYNLVRPLVKRYGPSKAKIIEYGIGDEWFPSSAVLPFTNKPQRVRVVYEDGLDMQFNSSDSIMKSFNKQIPKFGFAAKGKDIEADTSLRNGIITDYLSSSELIYADSRGFSFIPQLAATPKIHLAYKGKSKFDFSIEWNVVTGSKEEAALDLQTFVQFRDLDGIYRFGAHYTPPISENQWHKGNIIASNKKEISVPANCNQDEFWVLAGTHSSFSGPNTGGMVLLYDVGRIIIERKKGIISNISFKPNKKIINLMPHDLVERFEKRVNIKNIAIDFGSVATNGAVAIKRNFTAKTLKVYPMPRGKDIVLKLNLNKLTKGSFKRLKKIVSYDSAMKIIKIEDSLELSSVNNILTHKVFNNEAFTEYFWE